MEEDDNDEICIQRLRDQINQEKDITRSIKFSVNQWRTTVRDVLVVDAEQNQDEMEYKMRYHYQIAYNEMLTKKINDYRHEIRALRRGNGINTKERLEKMTLADCRMKVKHLDADLVSLNSLRNMYERQLDQEAMQYAKIKDRRSILMKDIFLLQNTSLRQLATFEKEFFERLRSRYAGELFRPSKMSFLPVGPINRQANGKFKVMAKGVLDNVASRRRLEALHDKQSLERFKQAARHDLYDKGDSGGSVAAIKHHHQSADDKHQEAAEADDNSEFRTHHDLEDRDSAGKSK